jgi:hypothetical protein
MRKDFPWLQIDELADYYEAGKPIEGEFIQSWNSIESFYRQDWCKFSEAVLAMNHAVRAPATIGCFALGNRCHPWGFRIRAGMV